MVTSSPVGSAMSPSLQNLVTKKRRSTGSYGCQREVLHPLDPRAEPSALLFYDLSSDEDDDDDFEPRKGLVERPTKRRLSFQTGNRVGEQGFGSGRNTRNVFSPNSSKVARPQEDSHLKSPSPHGRPGPDSVDESSFLEKFTTGLGLGPSTDNENIFLTPQRGIGGSSLFQRHQHQAQSPFTKAHISGITAPENTPAGVSTNLQGMSREAMGDQIKKTLRELNAEVQTIPETIHQLEPLIGGLMGYADSNNYQIQTQFVLEELINIGVITLGEAQKLTKLCDSGKAKMKQAAIIARWLAHGEFYGNKESLLNSKAPGCTPISSPNMEIRSNLNSPSFAFRSSKQQDFSPLQSRTFYTSATRSSRRKSDMAENIATLRRRLSHLHTNSEALGEARKLNASRESELFRHHHDQVTETHDKKIKHEENLDFQLQRLIRERHLQEEAIRQAQLRAEEQARRVEAWREEQERQRQAAEAAARQKALEEAERRKQEEEAKRRMMQEEAERKQREEAHRREQAQREALVRKEQENQQKLQEAEAKQKAAFHSLTAEQQRPAEGSGEYGRKSLETENAEMTKLLAALKDVRKQVQGDLLKQVSAKKRALNPKLGQLNGEVAQTNFVRQFIVSTLTEIKEANAGPMVDASIFQLNRDPRLQSKPPAQVPLLFIWMINELGKMVVRQVEAESAVSIKTANPIGVAVVSSLAREPLLANGRSFIDIIVARLWKKCPILQGVLGPEDTVEQRAALGWKKVDNQYEGDEPHVNRMVGYVAGFAAIAGRNFMNSSQLHNPYPQFNLWFILAYMANNPDRLTNTHFFCIKTMLEVAGDTLRKVYGREADKLIRILFTNLAEYGVQKKFAGAIGLQALGSKFEKDGKFS